MRGWGLQRRSDKALDDLARMFNPYIRGWINYYGHFYQSALYPTLRRIDARWSTGRAGSSNAFGKGLKARGIGSRKWLTPLLDSLLTGRFCIVEA